MADAALGVVQWVVSKALATVTDIFQEAWEGTRMFGPNVEVLRMELLVVEATLENATRKEISGPAMEQLLQMMRDSAHNAQDLLDELDYFRIHDKLRGTYEAADEHGEGGVQHLVRDVRHTHKSIRKRLASFTGSCFGANARHPQQEDARQHVSCCAWQHARHITRGDSSSAPNANQADQEVSPHPHVRGNEETPIPEFSRPDFSERMNAVVEKLRSVRNEVDKILQRYHRRSVLHIAQSRPTTTPLSAEPKLYGRDHVMKSIIDDITEGQYSDKALTVLPVIGPGGIGKTTLIQHIYNNQQVRNHFPVRIWICVSFNFNLGKVLEQIKRYTPAVEGENGCMRPEELIEHRLKSKRFILVLDDIWQFTGVDDWKKLLSSLGQSEKKGSVILVTTRQKEIADQVKKTEEPKELSGLEPEEFRKLFLVYVFDAEQYPSEKLHLRETGDKIMEKLRCSPLAAKTVGRLLRTDPCLAHWKRVLESKEWVKQINDNWIMPALELSYDFLPFHLQQCFSYSALFPEDYPFRSRELISLWIGLDILILDGQNQTLEDIGFRNLQELVIHGFFREEQIDGDRCYVMHDLLHDLALKVASHGCLSLRFPDVGSVKIQPTTRHLSISTKDLDEYDAVSGEKLKTELEKLKTTVKVEHLQTLMLFGEMDEGFAKILGDFFGEANALRVLYFPHLMCRMESVLHTFSRLVHLRCLCLGTRMRQMQLPPNISKFYHLRVLDLERWGGSGDFPEDMCNLAKLCHYYPPRDDGLQFDIYNVGKLKLLEKLMVFRVNKKNEGFEPKQLEHLTKLWELGIYNLEKIHTKEEAAQAKLVEKKCLRRLKLDWDSEQSSIENGVEAVVLESLKPHGNLQVLCIRGHGGPSCPTWLGDVWDLRELRLKDMARLKELIIRKSFFMLIKLELIGLGSFEKWVYTTELESSLGGDVSQRAAHIFPALQVLIIKWCPKILEFPISNHILYPDWFPKLQELEIWYCPEFSIVIPISWIESLHRVTIKGVKLLEEFEYTKSSDGAELEIIGKGDLHSLDQVLVFDEKTSLEKLTLQRCPPLELKHLMMLSSLKKLIVKCSDSLVGPLGGQGDVEWQLPVEYIRIEWLKGTSGKELIELLPHLPMLSRLEIIRYPRRDMRFSLPYPQPMGMMEGEVTAVEEEDDDGTLLFPAHLFDSLQDAHMFPLLQVLIIRDWSKLLGLPFSNHIVSPDWFPRLQELEVRNCPEFSSVIPISWIESLCRVTIVCVKLLQQFEYSKSSDGAELKIVGRGDLHSLDQVLVFDKETSIEKLTLERCPPLELKHLLMLTSLKTLIVKHSDGLVGPIRGQDDVKWQLPVEYIKMYGLKGNSGKDLTELLPHLPRLSKLKISDCENIKQLGVGVDVQQTALEASEMGRGEITAAAAEEEDDGVLLFPAHLCDSLLELEFDECPDLVLVEPSTLVPGRGGLQALRTLQRLRIMPSPRFLSRLEIVPSRHIFPSSLQFLELMDVKGLMTLEPLSNLSSLVTLKLLNCGEDLTCRGLQPLLSTGGQLKELRLSFSPKFFSGWEDVEGEEQQTHFVSSTLHELMTDDTAGFLAGPICSFLSSSLTNLKLCGHESERMERFSKEQDDALQLLSSLQELEFWKFRDLQQLPAGLRNLTSLKILRIEYCPAVSSLPNDGLPKSLQLLWVYWCGNEKLKQQCRGLVDTIPKIEID